MLQIFKHTLKNNNQYNQEASLLSSLLFESDRVVGIGGCELSGGCFFTPSFTSGGCPRGLARPYYIEYPWTRMSHVTYFVCWNTLIYASKLVYSESEPRVRWGDLNLLCRRWVSQSSLYGIQACTSEQFLLGRSTVLITAQLRYKDVPVHDSGLRRIKPACNISQAKAVTYSNKAPQPHPVRVYGTGCEYLNENSTFQGSPLEIGKFQI